MPTTEKSAIGLIFSLTAALITGFSNADANPIRLPTETAQFRYSELPGYALATQKCLICHSADYISYQPPNMNQAQWTAEVIKMRRSYGAQVSDNEAQSIGAYLAVAYGAAKATDAEIIAASTAPEPVTGSANPGAAIDVQRLLNTHACFGCHAIDKSLLGPAFSRIAAKYQGDAQARTKLTASIQKGSAGKWGPVPMPPMSGVEIEEAKALATFVLNQ